MTTTPIRATKYQTIDLLVKLATVVLEECLQANGWTGEARESPVIGDSAPCLEERFDSHNVKLNDFVQSNIKIHVNDTGRVVFPESLHEDRDGLGLSGTKEFVYGASRHIPLSVRRVRPIEGLFFNIYDLDIFVQTSFGVASYRENDSTICQSMPFVSFVAQIVQNCDVTFGNMSFDEVIAKIDELAKEGTSASPVVTETVQKVEKECYQKIQAELGDWLVLDH